MLIDSVTVKLKAGNGGNGAVSLRHDGQTAKGGPDGGDGGRGGSIYLQGSHDINDLKYFQYKKSVVADSGEPGKKKNMFGRKASDITLLLPIGTTVTDEATGKSFEIRDSERRFIIVRGGEGGRGNTAFKTATNRTPKTAEPGVPGEEKTVHFELKLIAAVGLVGLPNAGKSSLLSVLTNATPEIGAYPFTTLEPNIGMMGSVAIADIPGLIEGASSGKGLGIRFLKHIEKTKVLVHCIDISGTDLAGVYRTVRDELGGFNKTMLKKPEIILLTKTDLVDDEQRKSAVSLFRKKRKTVWTCSVLDDASISELKQKLLGLLETSDRSSEGRNVS